MFHQHSLPVSKPHEQARSILKTALSAEMISVEQLHGILTAGFEELVLLDIRTTVEQREMLIPGSTLYPCPHDLENRANLTPFRTHFTRTFNRHLFDGDTAHILICRTGPRAGIALEWMLKNGFRACELLGGIQEWQWKGLPLQRPSTVGTLH